MAETCIQGLCCHSAQNDRELQFTCPASLCFHIKMITCHLQAIKNLIAQYEQKYNRAHGSVQLLAVSKGQSLEKVKAAWSQGQTWFGENYVQEALTKVTVLPDACWHFIGRVQTNKTKKIAGHFQWVHSVHSLDIAKRLHAQRAPHLPPLDICIEVNVSHENSKTGASEEEVYALADACYALPRLKLRGLMTIPAVSNDLAKQRQPFRRLYELKEKLCARGLKLDTLSMGMSNDLEAAIAEGATIVRVGTALFGSRENHAK